MWPFRKQQHWENTFRLRSHHTIAKGFLAAIFWLWGVLGLLFNTVSFFGLTGSVGMGTSAYITASSLIWIGGMILFGLGALLSNSDFNGQRPVADHDGDIRLTR